MIAYIKGKILRKGESFVVVENAGLGYKVSVSPRMLENEIGKEIELYIYTHVREDILALFGFASPEDLEFFELLITVSGVGPKMALLILSADNTELIKQAIASQDLAIFTKVGGVGKKTAEKIILELKSKIGTIQSTGFVGQSSGEFVDALEALGYSNREIKEVLGKIDHDLPTEEKLKQALKLLAR